MQADESMTYRCFCAQCGARGMFSSDDARGTNAPPAWACLLVNHPPEGVPPIVIRICEKCVNKAVEDCVNSTAAPHPTATPMHDWTEYGHHIADCRDSEGRPYCNGDQAFCPEGVRLWERAKSVDTRAAIEGMHVR